MQTFLGEKKITRSQDDAIAFGVTRIDQSKARKLKEIRMVTKGEARDVGCFRVRGINS